MHSVYLAMDEHKRRVRKAEETYRFRDVGRTSRVSTTLKSLLALVARF